MSLSVTGVSFSNHVFDADASAADAKPIPTPTLAQRLQQLANAGLSNEQIATSAGITLSQVLTSLDETVATPTTPKSAGPDLVSLSARLSVKV